MSIAKRLVDPSEAWPALPLSAWTDTYATLHMWTQIVGKIRLAHSPMLNHWWQVPLYVTSRGLTTSAMPHGARTFQIDFDFIDHRLCFAASDGRRDSLPLVPRSVAEFYSEIMARLRALDLETRLWTMPVEIADPIAFEEDRVHAAYDPEQVTRFWRALVQIDQVFAVFRSRFVGKASPVHFFWGSFDLAVTRFSGRRAPRHPGGVPNLPDAVACEAYSHEECSAGFWPGSGAIDYPAFYSYAYPEPKGYREIKVRPDAAFFSEALGEFILPYDAVRLSAQPDQALLDFLQSTYEAAANAAKWDRDALECPLGRPCVVRKV